MLVRQLGSTRSRAAPWALGDAIDEAAAVVMVSGPPHGLTPRELDVLRLIVDGQSDRAIADTLFISRRTASKHVSTILAKLAVATRAEAAVRAVRDSLV
jgi:DNA-binding NarL/FixJ family response regulator